jgi:hypothetical protein
VAVGITVGLLLEARAARLLGPARSNEAIIKRIKRLSDLRVRGIWLGSRVLTAAA